MNESELREWLCAATHPLTQAPPHASAWNLAEIADLVPDIGVLRAAAVLVPIVLRPEGATLLLTKRNDKLTHHAGQISFPGGRQESYDDGPVETALRETREEVGIPSAWIEPLGYIDRLVTITGFNVVPVVGFVRDAPPIVIDRGEVAEVFEVPLTYALDRANRQLREREFRGRVRHYHVIQYGKHDIWGATAAMIANLSERIAAALKR